jgi:flagellar secretion chaperone FliS
MAINNPYQVYQKNAVTTASSADLTLMLYSAAIKFLHLSKDAMDRKDYATRNTNLLKVQDITKELMSSLDMNNPISSNLMAMYEYMNYQLIQANIKNDRVIIEEVEGYYTEFRDTWKEAMIIAKRQKSIGEN